MTYRHTAKPIDQISEELGADFVLEGSIRRVEERLRITAQLICTASQSHMWADTFESELGDLLRWQTEVAGKVATAAVPALLKSGPGRSSSNDVPVLLDISAEAYEAYLEGRYFADKGQRGFRDFSSFQAARRAFERALELAPEVADIHARLAWVRLRLAGDSDDFRSAAALARRALELDPDLGRALEILAFLDFYGSRWESAESRLVTAIEHEPALASAHHLYGLLLSAQGRHDEAIAAVERARRLDPVSLVVRSDRALLHLYARRNQEAIRCALQAIDLEPRYPWNYRWIIAAALAEGDRDLALRQARAEMLHTAGAGPAASEPIEDLEDYWQWRLRSASEFATPGELAPVHLGLGDSERALEILMAGCGAARDWMRQFLAVDPRFDPLRGNPRFEEVIRCARREVPSA